MATLPARPSNAPDSAVEALDPSHSHAIPLLDAAFTALDDAGAHWMVLRGDESSLRRGGDVDILVETGHADSIQAALLLLGLVPVPSNRQTSHRFYLGYDSFAKLWVTLDVVDSVAFDDRGQFRTSLAPDLLNRRVRSGDRYQINVEDAFWVALLRHLLNAQPRAVPDVLSGAAHIEAPQGPLARLLDDLGWPGLTARELHHLVACRRWEDVEALRPTLVRAWQGADPAMHHRRAVRDPAQRLTNAARSAANPTGLSVAIIGPDGAGKTTLAQGLRESLPIPSAYVYLGVWREYPWDEWLRHVPGTRLAMRIARLVARSWQVRYFKARGRVVLLDRFTYDVLLPSPGLDRRGRLTVALVRRICTDPDLVLVLDAPAQVMFDRKGEQGVEELHRRRLTYREVAQSLPHTATIDATQSVETVRREAEQAIWQRLRTHWVQ